MKQNWIGILGIVLGCACLASRALGVPLDVATQRVLQQYGMESKIVRSINEMDGKSPTGDGRFPFEIDGAPGIKLVLDRDYWILKSWSAKKGNDVIGYIFNPKDEQSALNISIGEDLHERTDTTLAQDPGFSFISHREGAIAGQPAVWRRWSDENHLYSDCTRRIGVEGDTDSKTYKVNVTITANSVARRQALEDSLASLRLCKSADRKETAAPAPSPTAKPVTPTPAHS